MYDFDEDVLAAELNESEEKALEKWAKNLKVAIVLFSALLFLGVLKLAEIIVGFVKWFNNLW